MPEKAAFGTQSLAAQPRDSAPRILRLFLRRTSGLLLGAISLRKWGLLAAKSARKRPLSAPEVWLPNDVIEPPRILRKHLGPDQLQKWGLLVAKSARIGCRNRPLSAPEIRLPNHVVKHPEFYALFLRRALCPFRSPIPPNRKWDLLAAKRAEKRVPEKAATGARNQAAQPRDSAPRTLRFS